jgi:glucose-6-phosphate dehydrogenase assembly protein OpcA
VTTTLWDTTGADVLSALLVERRAVGAVAAGLALSLVVVVEEKAVKNAEQAAMQAAQEHPCRMLVVVRRQLETADRLDAEVTVGGLLGPVETVVMRAYGRLTLHVESVVLPLLAPDAPVVTWWHGPPPDEIATDPVGVLADRRITDCSMAADPLAALHRRAEDFAPGDTDLAWSRTTGWRALLASAFDSREMAATGGRVVAEAGNPSAALLRGWLASRLGVPLEQEDSSGPGITEVELAVAADDDGAGRVGDGDGGGAGRKAGGGGDGRLSISRPDGRLATFARTGQPDRKLPLPRRMLGDLLAEELRRLDPDVVYAEALAEATGVAVDPARSPQRTFVWRDPALATPASGPDGS